MVILTYFKLSVKVFYTLLNRFNELLGALQTTLIFKLFFKRIKPILVPLSGLEPERLWAGDFESPVSTNSTTKAI